jgi:hypothetical protein
VDGGDFLLERRVDEAVPLKSPEVLELGGDDQGSECLATATWCTTSVSLCLSWREGGFVIWVLEWAVPDMSVTSTWIAPRRWVMASRREASVIEAIARNVLRARILVGGLRQCREEEEAI